MYAKSEDMDKKISKRKGEKRMNRIDEPLKSGACDECTHCVQVKRTRKCDSALTKQGKYISCREIRVCTAFNRAYKAEGQ